MRGTELDVIFTSRYATFTFPLIVSQVPFALHLCSHFPHSRFHVKFHSVLVSSLRDTIRSVRSSCKNQIVLWRRRGAWIVGKGIRAVSIILFFINHRLKFMILFFILETEPFFHLLSIIFCSFCSMTKLRRSFRNKLEPKKENVSSPGNEFLEN